jgi:hypothetical protein
MQRRVIQIDILLSALLNFTSLPLSGTESAECDSLYHSKPCSGYSRWIAKLEQMMQRWDPSRSVGLGLGNPVQAAFEIPPSEPSAHWS